MENENSTCDDQTLSYINQISPDDKDEVKCNSSEAPKNSPSKDNASVKSSRQDSRPESSSGHDNIHKNSLGQANVDKNSLSQDKDKSNPAGKSFKRDSKDEGSGEKRQADNLISSSTEITETDPGSEWRSRQVVEESIVRRRKGKSTEDTSDLPNDTEKTPQDTCRLQDDDSPEIVKKREKVKEIEKVLSSEPPDLETLKELAISTGGLVDDELRKEAWPLLMGLKLGEAEEKPDRKIVEGHRDYQQVDLDVKRTLKRFPPDIEDSRRQVLMDQLNVLIIRVLMKHPELYYYQGYHDVAITFLLVTGEDMGFQLVEKLSITHLRDFMRPTMEKTNYYLTYLYPILENANPLLYKCLDKSGVGTVFCLPWLITWFAHTLSDYRNVVRLYDFFLASPDLMPMYIATAIVLQKEQELLNDTENDITSIFVILSKDPDNLPFEDILVKARELYQSYPPHTLTQRVENIIAKREQREKEERQRIEEIRKKADSYSKNPSMMSKILTYLPFPRMIPAHQRSKIIKLALFGASIIIARSLYKHYYTSAIDYPLTQ